MIDHEFPHDSELIYLNHAGVGPWPRRAQQAIAGFTEENVRQGAREYPRWLLVEQRLRERLSRLVGAAGPEDVALVKNTSEGLSLVAYGLDWRPGDAVVINQQEFPSNRLVWESLRERFGVEVRDVDLAAGATPEDAMIAALDGRVRLLSVSSVQYASGLRMDLPRLAEACRRHGTLFCVDAIQSLGAQRFDARALEADFVIADGHKWMLGPEGLGVFYSRPEARERLRLTQFGWHMVEDMGNYDRLDWQVAPDARRFEAGSPNLLGAHGLEASLSLLEEIGLEEIERRVLANSHHLIEAVRRAGFELLTDPAPERLSGIVTFRPQGDLVTLHRELQAAGIICARRGGGIRFSPHFYNRPQQLDEAIAKVAALAG